MGQYELFDHTADLGLAIEGDDLADLFQTAGLALLSVVVANPSGVLDAAAESVKLDAESIDELLVVWLNELIYRLETRGMVFGTFALEISSGESASSLSGTLGGERLDPSRHVLDHEVKAATRHGAFVRRSRADGRWNAEVIVDI